MFRQLDTGMFLVWNSYLLVWNGVLSSIHGMEVLLEGDLCLFANLVPGLGVWHHLNHPTLQGRGGGGAVVGRLV